MKKCKTIHALLAISMFGLLITGCKKEESAEPPVEVDISLSETSITFQPNSEPIEVQVTANGAWSVSTVSSTNGPLINYTVTPTSGVGDGVITVSLKEVAIHLEHRNEFITVHPYGETTSNQDGTSSGEALYLLQGDENTIELTSPVNTSNESLIPTFEWEAIEPDASQPDNKFLYTVEVSLDGTSWNTVGSTLLTEYDYNATLPSKSTIYWRVTAKEYGSNYEYLVDGAQYTSWAEQFSTLTSTDHWEDGELRVYQESTKGEGAFTLVVTGDGFTAADLTGGGAWDEASADAIEALFSVEPYKSYREYVRVLRIGAESADSGASLKTNGTTTGCSTLKNTRFGTMVDTQSSAWCGLYDGSYTGQPGKTLGNAHDLIRSWVPEFTADEEKMENIAILIIINHVSYNGTVNYYTDANTTMGFVTRSAGTSTQTKYESIVIHEIGGHGIGHLADEYLTSSGSTLSEAKRTQTLEFHARGFYQNVDVSGSLSSSLWSHFKSGEYSQYYSEVDYYEGARSVGYGIWRPEYISCMVDNRHYFNAPSRESIVKRLLECAGESYNFDSFVENDLQTVKAASRSLLELEVDPNFTPLHEPQIWVR